MSAVPRPAAEAERVLSLARTEFCGLGEQWDTYQIDVELVGSLLFGLGVQRVPDLRVGDRFYAGFLDADSRLVGVEGTHHQHRQRFSIAHEIGHFVLHYLPQRSDRRLFACTSADMELDAPASKPGEQVLHIKCEAEANQFAGALLMPAPSVKAMHKVTAGRLGSMAKHFDVSPKAMEIRLQQLGLPAR